METLSRTRKTKPPQKISLENLEKKIKKPWSPISIAELNGIISVRMVRFQGEFPKWHFHANEDEFFLVLDGEAVIQTEHGNVTLAKGDGTIVHRGIKHCSKSENGAIFLVIERTETKPAGDG